MNLKLFPHDVQTCDLLQTSCMYPVNLLYLHCRSFSSKRSIPFLVHRPELLHQETLTKLTLFILDSSISSKLFFLEVL
jgi:hypothetical protein